MGAGQNKEPVVLTSSSTIRRSGDWLTAQIGDELVMMNSATGRHIGLTETGRRIWELLEPPSTIARICTVLAQEYDAGADEMAADVEVFVRELAGHGAVTAD
jgi:hypothetical protein